MMYIPILFVSLVCLGQGAKLPSTYKICKRTDPKISECFKEAVQNALPQLKNGIPELNFAPIEPIIIKSMTVEAGSGALNVLQKYSDVRIYNISNSIVEKTNIKVEGDVFNAVIDIVVPQSYADSDYDFDGHILMLPINGKGKCTMIMENAKVKTTMSGKKIEKRGKAYLKVTNLDVDFMPDKGTFHFDNLFNGDENLGNEMNNMINANWKDLFGEVKAGYEETLAALFKNAANAIFSKVPLDDIFPE